MPREIQTVKQHGPKWYRISKEDGDMSLSSSVNVWMAASGYYDNATEVIQAGRFQTPFSVYSDEFNLTEAERTHLTA